MIVYLSSTLDDLRKERQAVKDVLGGECIVKESYTASEQELVASCLADVADCDLYIGIVGLRYGFIPVGEERSITELEYEAAGEEKRLIFLKHEGAIPATQADPDWRDKASKIACFRQRVAEDQRPAMFDSVDKLQLEVQRAVFARKASKSAPPAIMAGSEPHPWEFSHDIAFGYVPGTDAELRDSLTDAAAGDKRVEIFRLSPAEPVKYLTELDAHARRARAVVLPISRASLARIDEARDVVCRAVRIVRERAPVFALLVGVTRAELAPPLAGAFVDLHETPPEAWSVGERVVSLAAVRRWLHEHESRPSLGRHVGIPALVLAPTIDEAQKLCGDAAIFDRFKEGAEMRRKAFADLRSYLAARGLSWPQDFYGPARDSWRPFGPQEKTVREFVEEAARKANSAPDGSRERRRLRDQVLVPQWYRFEEYLDDRGGSRDNLAAVCDAGCLVLLDEFALLHAELREPIETLVASDNAAVVVLSACDPAHSPLRKLLDDFSHLNLGNLRNRFRNTQDPCCELALNSITRLQRWLRLVLPELWATLGQQQGNPALLQRPDALLGP